MNTMMNGVAWALLLVAAPALAAQGRNQGDTTRRAEMRQRMEARVKKDLGLTDDQAAKLRATKDRFRTQRRDVMQRQRAIHEALRGQLQPGVAANSDSVRKLLDAGLQGRSALLQLDRDQDKELAGYLTPVQRARMEMMVLHSRYRGMRGGPGRRGGHEGMGDMRGMRGVYGHGDISADDHEDMSPDDEDDGEVEECRSTIRTSATAGPFRSLAHAPLHRVAAHVFAVSVAFLLVPSTGLAQSVDLGAHGAFHFPIGSLIEGPPIEKRLLAGLMVGVDAFVWMTGRLGFAGKVAYGPTRVAVSQARNVVDREASVILASARVLFALTPLTTAAGVMPPWAFYVGAGAGLASRSGAIWSYASGRTSPALVLNAGSRDPRRATGRDAHRAGGLHVARAVRRRDAERNRSADTP